MRFIFCGCTTPTKSWTGTSLRHAALQERCRALGKGALKTGTHIDNNVLSGQNIKMAAKHRVADASKNMLSDHLFHRSTTTYGYKHTVVTKRVSRVRRGMTNKNVSRKRRHPAIFGNGVFAQTIMRKDQVRAQFLHRTSVSDQRRRQLHGAASSRVLSRVGWINRVRNTRFRRRLPGSRPHNAARSSEGDETRRHRPRCWRSRESGEYRVSTCALVYCRVVFVVSYTHTHLSSGL